MIHTSMQQPRVDRIGSEANPIQVALLVAPGVRQALGETLQAVGMSVQAWETPAAFDGAAAAASVDAVIVDAGAFGADAYALTTRLRLNSGVGIVVLVAGARRADRMLALSLGADHCLASPPDPHELELHLRNLHRRVRSPATVAIARAQHATDASIWRVWRFDATEWTLTTPGGRSTTLTMTDYRLLGHLLREPGAVVSREELLEELERHGVRLASRNLDMIVSRLRKKVARDCGERLPVRSARSVGYVFAGQCETVQAQDRTPVSRERS